MTTDKIKVGDRVKRLNKVGCQGEVKELREETRAAATNLDDRGVLVSVHWDDGTSSFFDPEALEVVKK